MPRENTRKDTFVGLRSAKITLTGKSGILEPRFNSIFTKIDETKRQYKWQEGLKRSIAAEK